MRQVNVYVKSVKTIVGMKEFERRTLTTRLSDRPSRAEIEGKRMKGTFVLKTYATEEAPQYEHVLSEDQHRIVEMVKEIASKYGIEVKIVDIDKKNVLRRTIWREFVKIRNFPTLVTDSGEMYQGVMTREQLDAFLSKVAKTNLT